MKEVRGAKAILLLAAAAAWGALCGCNRSQPPRPQRIPQVTVAMPLQADISDSVDFRGTTKETESLDVRARVQGFLESVEFTDGSLVKKNDLLFVIEPELFQARVDEAEARLEATKAQLKLAQSNLKRAAQSLESNVISREEFSTRTAQHDKSKAAVLEAHAVLEQAKIDLGYTKIYAPFSGRADQRLVDPGNLVGAGDHTLLTTVRKLDPIYVYFDIGEFDFLEFLKWKYEHGGPEVVKKREKVVYMKLSNEEGFPHEGKIDFAENTMDAMTGTQKVRAIFPNKKGLIPAGAFATVYVPGPPIADALLVSDRAIGSDLTGKYLMLVGNKDIVERRYVKLGPVRDGMRVIEKGIGPDDRYIIKGIQYASDGAPVKWTETEEPLSIPDHWKAEAAKTAEASPPAVEASPPAADGAPAGAPPAAPPAARDEPAVGPIETPAPPPSETARPPNEPPSEFPKGPRLKLPQEPIAPAESPKEPPIAPTESPKEPSRGSPAESPAGLPGRP